MKLGDAVTDPAPTGTVFDEVGELLGDFLRDPVADSLQDFKAVGRLHVVLGELGYSEAMR
jgi:hypothetical protein